MKLYYLPGACSLASLICLHEAGIPVEAIAVDRATRKAGGVDFATINPKGYVPALVLDSGEVLTESVAVLSYIATLNPGARLAPAPGSLGWIRVLEWLAFINSEIHKNYSPLFRPGAPDAVKSVSREQLARRLAYVESRLGDQPYLTGESFTVADAYLYVVLCWSPRVDVDLAGLPHLKAFVERCQTRPAVQAARKAESPPH